jgi:ADP-ribose pyrophosphatase YjhB (NUDIX family)
MAYVRSPHQKPSLFKTLLRHAGILAFWLAWPLYIFYFKLSERTRVLVVCGDEILVVANWVSDGKWSLPGGGMHPSETPAQGAQRELREEVDLEVSTDQLQPIGKGEYRAYGHSYVFHCFALPLQAQFVVRKQLHEIADAAWMDYRLLDYRNAAPDVLRSIELWQESLATDS